MKSKTIYHLARNEDWAACKAAGIYSGSEQDKADGFLHFSTGYQIEKSAELYRSGEAGLLLIEVDAAALGGNLKWEPSRDGALFPHLYGDLAMSAVSAVTPLELDPDGRHRFPPLKKD